MDADSIQDYAKLENSYWWFVGRRKVIANVLKKYFSDRQQLRILDWGCGPGGNFSMLSEYGQVLGVDASDEALKVCRAKGITNLIKAGTLQEFHTTEKFDLVTNFDVLEHIHEDEEFLKALQGLLKPDGYILVTVPAYQFLWSELDKTLGHVRRYTRGELCLKFERSGYEVIKASYFIFFLGVPFIVFRFLQKFRQAKSLNSLAVDFPFWVNKIFTWLIYFEAVLMRYINLPFGTSIMVLARKQH